MLLLMDEITPEKAVAELWLRAWCSANDCPGFDAVVAVVRDGSWSDGDADWPSTGRWSDWDEGIIHFDGVDAHASIPPEFWDHMAVYLGRPIPEDERATGFSCSC